VSPIGATVLRIMLGVTFLAHGYYIYDTITSDVLSAMITKRLSLPLGDFITSYIIIAHFLGGVMLILGVFSRVAAMANLPIMIGAVLLFHFDQGFFLRGVIVDAARNKVEVVGYEYALFILAATLAQCFLGTGAVGLTKN